MLRFSVSSDYIPETEEKIYEKLSAVLETTPILSAHKDAGLIYDPSQQKDKSLCFLPKTTVFDFDNEKTLSRISRFQKRGLVLKPELEKEVEKLAERKKF